MIDDNATGVVIGSSPTDTAIHDAILGNSIYGNTKLGIDLGNDGVTPNDSEGHSGPNLFQDFPVITEAYTVGSTTTITGTVSGPANSTLRVELFSNPAADPSGYGQGKVFLGYVTVTTGAGGGGSFTFSPSSPVAVGQFISATATDVNGDTSEFAQDAQVSATAPLDIGYQIIGPVVQPDQEGLHRDGHADQRRNVRGPRLRILAREPDPRRDVDQRQRHHVQRHPLHHGQHDPQSQPVDHRDLDLLQDVVVVVH